MKILVIDMPEHCGECSYCNNNKICLLNLFSKKEKPCDVENAVSVHSRPSWCPLKPMPTKKKPLFDPNHCEIEEEIKIVHEIVGYNRCIDEIKGETE